MDEESTPNLDSGFYLKFYQITIQFAWCTHVGCLKLCSESGRTSSVKLCLGEAPLPQDLLDRGQSYLYTGGILSGSLTWPRVATLPANEAAKKLTNT